MSYNRDDPNSWPCFKPLIIAHDVGRSRDRSTAVIGGNSPVPPRLLGIKELTELPQGFYGSNRASALAMIDRRYHSDALIVADLSNDATYAEVLFDTFGPRMSGCRSPANGDGMNSERRPSQKQSDVGLHHWPHLSARTFSYRIAIRSGSHCRWTNEPTRLRTT